MSETRSKGKMKTAFMIWMFAACAMCALGQASLKGLTGVRVVVELDEGRGTGEAAEKVLTKFLGLDKDPVQTEIELRLREAGMLIRPLNIDSAPLLFR